MPANRFVVQATTFNSVTYGGLSAAAERAGIELASDQSSGEIYASLRTRRDEAPEITLTTFDVGAWLDLLFAGGSTVPAVAINAGTGPLDLFYKRKANRAADAGDDTHQIKRITRGVIVPQRLYTIEGKAALDLMIYADWDGTNRPVQELTAQGGLPASGHPAKLQRLHSVRNGTAGTIFSDLVGASLALGINVTRERSEASVFPLRTIVQNFAPTIEFETHDVAGALPTFLEEGASVGAGGLILYLVDAVTAGYSLSGAASLTLAATSLLRVGDQITLGPAEIRVPLVGIGLGGDAEANTPLAYATGVTAPATPADPPRYVLGPVKIGATEIEIHESGGSIRFERSLPIERPLALAHPNHISLTSSNPMIELRTVDANFVAGLGGFAVLGGDFTLGFQQTVGAVRVARATTQHVKLTITAANGTIRRGDQSAGHAEIVAPAFVVETYARPTVATGVAL